MLNSNARRSWPSPSPSPSSFDGDQSGNTIPTSTSTSTTTTTTTRNSSISSSSISSSKSSSKSSRVVPVPIRRLLFILFTTVPVFLALRLSLWSLSERAVAVTNDNYARDGDGDRDPQEVLESLLLLRLRHRSNDQLQPSTTASASTQRREGANANANANATNSSNEADANANATATTASDVDVHVSESSSSSISMTTIFYNIYLPPADLVYDEKVELGDAANALRIITEQLDQIGNAEAFQIQTQTQTETGKKPVQIFYTTVGDDSYLNETYMHYLCWERNQITCKHLGHYKQAFENATLQPLHEFCSAQTQTQTPTTPRRVVYVHSKGTYHHYTSGINDRWRYFLTHAATSRSCLDNLSPQENSNKSNSNSNSSLSSSVNVCALQFWPIAGTYFPGNMWAADCSYISKLIPPKDFPAHTKRLEATFTKLLQERRILPTLYDFNVPWLKIDRNSHSSSDDRYIWEVWVAMHPDLRPGELSLKPQLRPYFHRDTEPELSTLQLRQTPRHELRQYTFLLDDGVAKKVLDTNALRLRDYYLLPGNIVKWQTLYNAVPSASSWVWSWFPDGDMWRNAVSKYGTRAIEVVTDTDDTNPLVTDPPPHTDAAATAAAAAATSEQ